MIRAVFLSFALLATPVAAQAQDGETLADIRQDLSVLNFELQKLRRELSTTSGSDVQVGGGTIDRVNTIEAELQRLTSRTEELTFRIDRVVQDGTNRIGDLEFRLCELEDDCDIGSLGETPSLGGTAPATGGSGDLGDVPTDGTATPSDIEVGPGPAPAEGSASSGGDSLPIAGGAQLAAAEEADFREAQAALNEQNWQAAADAFASFRQTYPGGPLDSAALLGRGRALEGLGDTREASRAYLEAWNTYPDAQTAPEALFLLGRGLGRLGSTQEACVTLSEVATRYPGSDAVGRAQQERQSLGCQ
ncbi:tol-pal system protein YbgF [Roseivivax halotolerans]|uniref:Cell division coordinator CpoB n=1 Tax=Roseivivax halotolerans TaxID=93684 RepID=A0A1I5UK65_9RHOB|nr:tetratricopeptide repeat protein [Roseivivax halotolerans]SFP95579.1 tol-pal system protein YbgF [Roseivivax halotolerans]